jgi:transcriptional regulator with XRE-family HTH domain
MLMTYHAKIMDPEALGRVLQQARLLSGFSQRELAQQLGVSQRYVWELESGKPSIALTRLFEAMRATGMSLSAEITPKDRHG